MTASRQKETGDQRPEDATHVKGQSTEGLPRMIRAADGYAGGATGCCSWPGICSQHSTALVYMT
jgi:hypothetical protein